MRTVIQGLSGWARMQPTGNPSVKVADAAITIVGTMLVALTWFIVQR